MGLACFLRDITHNTVHSLKKPQSTTNKQQQFGIQLTGAHVARGCTHRVMTVMMCSCSDYDWLQMTCDLDGAVMLSVEIGASWWGPALRAGCADATLGRGRFRSRVTRATLAERRPVSSDTPFETIPQSQNTEPFEIAEYFRTNRQVEQRPERRG